MINFELVVFGTNRRALEQLASVGTNLKYVRFVEGVGPVVARGEKLDAVLMTLMEAERFGIAPPFRDDEAVVARTPEWAISKGIAPHIVAGVQTKLKNPRDWRGELSTLLKAAFRAIRQFNESGGDIRRIGVLADDL
jgi:hypothetical protein